MSDRYLQQLLSIRSLNDELRTHLRNGKIVVSDEIKELGPTVVAHALLTMAETQTFGDAEHSFRLVSLLRKDVLLEHSIRSARQPGQQQSDASDPISQPIKEEKVENFVEEHRMGVGFALGLIAVIALVGLTQQFDGRPSAQQAPAQPNIGREFTWHPPAPSPGLRPWHPGAPRNPQECIEHGGTDVGRGCIHWH